MPTQRPLLESKKKASVAIVNTAPSTISQVEPGPLPRIIGMGPIRITAPPLVTCPCVKEANVMRIIPATIITKLAKNIQDKRKEYGLAGLCISG